MDEHDWNGFTDVQLRDAAMALSRCARELKRAGNPMFLPVAKMAQAMGRTAFEQYRDARELLAEATSDNEEESGALVDIGGDLLELLEVGVDETDLADACPAFDALLAESRQQLRETAERNGKFDEAFRLLDDDPDVS